MSETIAHSSGPIPPPRRRGWMGLLVLGTVFLSGMICGAGLAVIAVRRAAQQAVQHPELRPGRAAQWMTRQFKLDAAQQDRVRSVLEGQYIEIEKLRQEVWPRVIRRLDDTEREIGEALSPPQRQKWRKTAERLRKNWLPPNGNKQ